MRRSRARAWLRREAWSLPAIGLVLVAGLLPTLEALSGVLDPEAWSALASPVLWERLARSLGLGAATLAVAVPGGLLLAWVLVRCPPPGGRLWLGLAALPLFLPPLVHVIAWFGLLGLTGVPAIITVSTLSAGPLVTLCAAHSLARSDRGQVEARRLVGGLPAVLAGDLRRAFPAALLGGGLATVLSVSDFAVADFLTSVGPKVTVYGDSLFALYLAGDSAGAAVAALPGLFLCLCLLLPVLRASARSGRDTWRAGPAAPLALGRARLPVTALTIAVVAAASLVPLVALVLRVGSWQTFVAQLHHAAGALGRSLALAGLAATALAGLGLVLASRSLRRRPGWLLDALVLAPLAVPAVLFGVGLVQVWNRPAFDAVYLGLPVVVLACVGRYLAFSALPLRGAAGRLDRRLFEAAALAGASRPRRAWLLLRWLAWPLGNAWCIGFCFALRELDSLVMLRAGHDTLLYLLYRNVVFSRADEVAALALIALLTSALPLLLWQLLAPRPLEVM